MIRRYCCFIIVESSYNGDKKRQKNKKTTHCVKGLCYNNKCLEEQDTTLIKELRSSPQKNFVIFSLFIPIFINHPLF